MFLFDEQRLLLRIGLDFFDGQRDQLTLALGCSAELCRCQEVHANLEFVSRNVLQYLLELLDNEVLCFVGDNFFAQLLELDVQELEASFAGQLVAGGNLNKLQMNKYREIFIIET